MTLTILRDEEISALLNVLTIDELESFRSVLKHALFEYSTGTQAVKDGEIQQPPRTSVTSPATGATTLFMPSCSTDGIGMKVLTIAKPKKGHAAKPGVRPTGALTLYSESGSPIGFLHANTLTAFRTALASACLLLRRDTVRNVTVFGCGEQAYWHVRLTLLLRGSTVRHVNIISRSFDSSRQLLARFYGLPQFLKDREGWNEAKFSILTTGYNDYARLLSENLRSSDVIYCCTPSTEPLFDHTILTNHEGRRKGRLLIAIGSYTHEMREVPAELLRQATKPFDRNHMHYHKHAVEGGVIVVDTLDGALKEAGEIADAGLGPRHLVELGELVMLSRIALHDDDDSSEDFSSLSTISTGSTVASAATPPAASDAPSAQFEKFSLTGPAMSSVYGQDSTPSTPAITTTNTDMSTSSGGNHSRPQSPPTTANGGTGGSHSRTSSPSRKSSGGGSGSSLLSSLTPRNHRRSSSQVSVERRKKKENHSARWLQRGNVIYKSVGLGLMDLSVGLHLIDFARKKNVGAHVDGF